MQSEIFCICEYAQDNNSKLNLNGTFNAFTTSQLPFLPSFYIAGRINLNLYEIGQLSLKINVYKNGDLFLADMFTGNANVDAPTAGNFSVFTFALPVNVQTPQIEFSEIGEYEFKLFVNNNALTSVKLNITM